MSRKPHTEEWKKMMSKRNSGKNNPFFGKKHKSESKINMGLTKKALKIIPWNKNLTKDINDCVKKYGESSGKTRMGMVSSKKGVPMSESQVVILKKVWKEKYKNGHINAFTGKTHSLKWRESRTAEKHPLWKGGIRSVEKRIRQSLQYKQWRDEIFKRDNFTCMDCGERGGQLHAHHIKAFALLLQEAREIYPLLSIYDAAMLYAPLWDVNNGITYCEKGHKEFHKQLKIIEEAEKQCL